MGRHRGASPDWGWGSLVPPCLQPLLLASAGSTPFRPLQQWKFVPQPRKMNLLQVGGLVANQMLADRRWGWALSLCLRLVWKEKPGGGGGQRRSIGR